MYSPCDDRQGSHITIMNKSKSPSSNLSKQSNLSKGQSQNVNAPVARTQVRVVNNPKVRNGPAGDVTVTHREYINEIAGSVAFAVNTFSVNPGLPGVFPWLSGIAQRYESYRFNSLKFCFETEAATSATGSLVMAIDYDADDPAPDSKTQAMSYRSSVRSAPWAACCLTSKKEDLSKRASYYVRGGALNANEDQKLYDTGNLYVCTQSQAGTTVIGELYVEYQVHLMTPQIGSPSLGSAVYGWFQGLSNSAPAATVILSNLPATIVSTGTTTSSTTFTFSQPWQGFVTITSTGTGITGATGTTGTCTATEQSDQVNGTNTVGVWLYIIKANIGQTFIVVITNTTISGANWYFGQALIA